VGILESGWRAVTRVNKEVVKRLINEAEEALDEIKKIFSC
jgi:hypothetical protein